MNAETVNKFKFVTEYEPGGSLPLDNSINTYYRAISRIPLIDHEKELELSKRIEAGDMEARKQLIEANLRLVASIAKRFIGRGLPLADLIQAGNLGLIAAADKYDYRKNTRFSTHAVWWIKKAIFETIRDNRSVRLPVNRVDDIIKINRIIPILTQRFGREPSPEEIAAEMKLSPDRLKEIIRVSQLEPVSLNSFIGVEEETGEIIDFIEDKETPGPDEQVFESMFKTQFEKALKPLTRKEKRIVSLRYGLNGDREMTLQEIGEAYKISRERVRQIINKALKALNEDTQNQRLIKFMNS